MTEQLVRREKTDTYATMADESEMSQKQPQETNEEFNRKTKKKKPKLSQGIQDRMWEKEQLHEINLRVDNIFTVFEQSLTQKKFKEGTLNKEWLDDLRAEQTKAMKDLADNYATKDANKAQQVADLKAEIRFLEDKCAEMDTELKDLTAKNDNLKIDYMNLKNEAEKATQEKDKTLLDDQNLKDILETKIKLLEEENKRLCDIDGIGIEGIPQGKLSIDFNARLSELLQDRDEQYNKLKEETDKAFEQQMELVEKTYQQQLVDANDIIEKQKKDLTDLQAELLRWMQETDQAKNDFENEKTVRELVENDLNKYKDQTKEDLKRAKDRADQAQKEHRKVSDQYFELQKMTLDLRAEIDSLKQKLDMFEEQHKIESPARPKKRRRIDSPLMEAKILKSVQGAMIEAHTTFPLECVTRQYEGDWIGFELQNQWSTPIVLKGWFLSDADRFARLSLPGKKLNPKEIIRVCLTENKKEPNDVLWKGLEIKKGQRHELWVEDSLGLRHKIATVPIPSTAGGFTAESCFVM